ncbi:flagellar biosynthesis protein FlhF, partial [Pseudomonas aeruginosa]|nr:flagellar biosynthesis protein FlhF [Pseudomonas aeruginosa]
MQVKRFFAADMRQAMKLVRDELGPDAAILGNRRVAGGIELTAALDYQA